MRVAVISLMVVGHFSLRTWQFTPPNPYLYLPWIFGGGDSGEYLVVGSGVIFFSLVKSQSLSCSSHQNIWWWVPEWFFSLVKSQSFSCSSSHLPPNINSGPVMSRQAKLHQVTMNSCIWLVVFLACVEFIPFDSWMFLAGFDHLWIAKCLTMWIEPIWSDASLQFLSFQLSSISHLVDLQAFALPWGSVCHCNALRL